MTALWHVKNEAWPGNTIVISRFNKQIKGTKVHFKITDAGKTIFCYPLAVTQYLQKDLGKKKKNTFKKKKKKKSPERHFPTLPFQKDRKRHRANTPNL